MGKNFKRIRKKTRLSAWITAVILGIGVGIAVFSGLFLWKKLLGEAMPLWAIPVAGGVTLFGTVIAALFFSPSDRALAKRLDEEHRLEEKMRTMVEFRNSEDPFAKLQREDADERLGQLRISSWRRGQLLAALLVLVISVGCFTGAALVPEKEAPAGPTEDPMSEFDKQYILADLADLIATVEKSLMTESLKQSTLEELNRLVEFVRSHDYLSEMKVEAVTVVVNTNRALYEVNTASRIGEKLENASSESLRTIGSAMKNLSGSKVKKALEDLEESLEKGAAEDADFAADELSAALGLTGIAADELLMSRLTGLAASLRSYSDGEGKLSNAFRGLPTELSNEVLIQNINKMTMQTVVSRLCTLFGISPEDLAAVEGGEDIDTRPPSEVLPPEEEDTEVKEPDKEIGSGGMGSGDRVYGSNDVIYNPYTNSYVAYGEILDEYNAKATEKLVDGVVPQDFAAFIEEYFKSLSEYKPADGAEQP